MRPSGRWRRAAAASAISAAMSLGAVGCGDDGPPAVTGDGYTEEHRDDFLATCTADGEDFADECGCLFERIQEEIPIERYEELLASSEELPLELVVLAAECG